MKIVNESLWREYESNEITHSGAHYLMAVAAYTKKSAAPRAADLARYLGVSRAAVSLQLKSLLEQRLLRYNSEKKVELTRSGADLVARIYSKREALRVFLRDVLGVSEETAELDGCKIEHLISEETGGALIGFIQFLSSNNPVARKFKKTFSEISASCPGVKICRFCPDVCLRKSC